MTSDDHDILHCASCFCAASRGDWSQHGDTTSTEQGGSGWRQGDFSVDHACDLRDPTSL
jgi:hypothetical protein